MNAKKLVLLAAFLSLALVACSATEWEETSDDEHAERFVRSWLITGAGGWALLPTATVYRFESDGAITIERQLDGSYFEGPVGSWVQADGTTSCWFGNYWRSVGSTVVIDAECDDGTVVEDWLQFSEDATLNSERPSPELVTPANASPRWSSPQGQFRLCSAVEGDEFQLSCAAP